MKGPEENFGMIPIDSHLQESNPVKVESDVQELAMEIMESEQNRPEKPDADYVDVEVVEDIPNAEEASRGRWEKMRQHEEQVEAMRQKLFESYKRSEERKQQAENQSVEPTLISYSEKPNERTDMILIESDAEDVKPSSGGFLSFLGKIFTVMKKVGGAVAGATLGLFNFWDNFFNPQSPHVGK